MPQGETKSDMVRDQVIAKTHWGAPDEEVLEWLDEQHRISGREADELIAAAHAAKRKAVRSKAILRLVFSAIGILVPATFFALQFMQGLFVIGYGSFPMIGWRCQHWRIRSQPFASDDSTRRGICRIVSTWGRQPL